MDQRPPFRNPKGKQAYPDLTACGRTRIADCHGSDQDVRHHGRRRLAFSAVRPVLVEGCQTFLARLFLMLGLPLSVRHTVDDLPRLVLAQR